MLKRIALSDLEVCWGGKVPQVQLWLGNHTADSLLGILPAQTSSTIGSVISAQIPLIQSEVWFLPQYLLPAQPAIQTHLDCHGSFWRLRQLLPCVNVLNSGQTTPIPKSNYFHTVCGRIWCCGAVECWLLFEHLLLFSSIYDWKD